MPCSHFPSNRKRRREIERGKRKRVQVKKKVQKSSPSSPSTPTRGFRSNRQQKKETETEKHDDEKYKPFPRKHYTACSSSYLFAKLILRKFVIAPFGGKRGNDEQEASSAARTYDALPIILGTQPTFSSSFSSSSSSKSGRDHFLEWAAPSPR